MRINKFWQDRSVLVTGATGLVGSWVVKALIEHQANVVALIRDWVPFSELNRSFSLNNINVVRGDLRDYNLMQRIIAEYEVKTIIHLAAQTIVVIANRSPLSTFESNLQGTWNLLEAARVVGGVEQIIIASTDKAYGEQPQLPYDESTPLQGQHPYDVSKSCADLIAQAYHKTYGLPVAITRCGNFYGGGDLNWNRIIPGTIRSIIRSQNPIIRSNGEFIRDYFYVEDGASSYLHVAECLAANPSLAGEAFNFSTETPVTVIGIVNLILELMSAQNLEPIILNQVKNEIPNQYLSSKKARQLLNWKPQFDLRTGLLRSIKWYQQFFKENREVLDDRRS